MTVKTLNDLQKAFTEKVSSYLQQGFMIAFGDSSRGCYLRTELTKGNQNLSIYVDDMPLKSIFADAPYLDYYQFVVEDNENGIISKTILYPLSTAAPMSSSIHTFKYITDLEEFKAILAKRKERFEANSKSSSLPMTRNQSLLRKMVKGSDGFGKKALAGATILVERRQYAHGLNGYQLTNSKTNAQMTIQF